MIADQQQRERALDITQSFIVQAPAGSGKTELISQRFLALLAHTRVPEAVLAITFTRKAASEMRLRIITALENAASQPCPETGHLRKTWQLARAVLQQDEQQQWQLLHNPSRLRVLTIDSLNASLVRQMPVLSGLGGSASVTEQPAALYREAARQTLQLLDEPAYAGSLGTLMLHLGNNSERILQLLMEMLARREQWLRHFVGTRTDTQRRQVLEQALQHYTAEHLSNLKQQMPAGLREALCELADFAHANLPQESRSIVRLWQGNSSLHADWQTLEQWQILAELLLTGSDEPRKSVNKNLGFPAASSVRNDSERQALLQQQKQRLLDLIGEVSASPVLLEQFIGLRYLPAPHYSDAQWQLVEALSEVLLLAAMQLKLVFAAQGRVDFSEIASAASEALGDAEQPTELAMILDYRLEHLLVDEFQDTSESQVNLLNRLVAGWTPGDGRSLFLVGDPMQSIYRFRQADVGLFLQAERNGLGSVPLEPLKLSVNFRSSAVLVNWVNQHLAGAFAAENDIASGAIRFSASQPFHDPGDASATVRMHTYAGRNDQAEADAVASLVREHLQQRPGKSLAILVRSRGHLATIIETLGQQQLPFQGVDLDPLQSRPCIVDLYSLARALDHQGDRLHWLALLRAPWCGLLLSDLEILAGTPASLVLDNCRDTTLRQQLSADGRQRLDKLLATLDEFLQGHGELDLVERLEQCWHALGAEHIYATSDDVISTRRFFDLLGEHCSGGRIRDVQLFDEALGQLYAPPDSRSRGEVQVMTIHKSKGLEFDTVILPGFGRRPKTDDPQLLEWLERPAASGHSELLMAPMRASEEAASDSISNSLKKINRDKARHENTRLLYVALTRARSRLHLFSHLQADRHGNYRPEKNSLLDNLWPNLAETVLPDELLPAADSAADDAHSLYTPLVQRLPLHWQLPAVTPLACLTETVTVDTDAGENLLEFDWAGETARHIGIVTHRLLEQLADNPPAAEHWQDAQPHQQVCRALADLGTQQSALQQAASQVINALFNCCDDERGRWLLSAHQQARSEYPVTLATTAGFRRYIIDRTFIDEHGTRWIVDFKTGSHEGSDIDAFLDREQERYCQQLENYAAVFCHLEQRPIRLGLYFPLLRGWREWAFDCRK